MILQLVTDRRRLAPGVDAASAVAALFEQAARAVAAGLDMIQVREPDLDGRMLTEITAGLVALARGTRTRVLVNERLDVALAARAHGVHLRAASFEATRVRTATPPGFIIGRSVHDSREAADAGPVDYLTAGTIWASASKPDGHALLGVAGLAQVVAASLVPVLAVGGVEPSRVSQVASVGAAGVAAIGAWTGEPLAAGGVSLHEMAEAFRAAFDTANMKGQFPHSNGL